MSITSTHTTKKQNLSYSKIYPPNILQRQSSPRCIRDRVVVMNGSPQQHQAHQQQQSLEKEVAVSKVTTDNTAIASCSNNSTATSNNRNSTGNIIDLSDDEEWNSLVERVSYFFLFFRNNI